MWSFLWSRGCNQPKEPIRSICATIIDLHLIWKSANFKFVPAGANQIKCSNRTARADLLFRFQKPMISGDTFNLISSGFSSHLNSCRLVWLLKIWFAIDADQIGKFLQVHKSLLLVQVYLVCKYIISSIDRKDWHILSMENTKDAWDKFEVREKEKETFVI